MKNTKQRLFEMMNKVSGMPIKEFEIRSNQNYGEYQELVEFIGESKGYLTYLHTTNSEEHAKSICNNGFQFEDFAKTTDYVGNIDGLLYMLSVRKAYGNFTIIIQINLSIKNDYEAISKKTTDEDGNEIYILPPQYIKGYYDRTTKEIHINPLFKK